MAKPRDFLQVHWRVEKVNRALRSVWERENQEKTVVFLWVSQDSNPAQQ
jgi:hypothetical protein